MARTNSVGGRVELRGVLLLRRLAYSTDFQHVVDKGLRIIEEGVFSAAVLAHCAKGHIAILPQGGEAVAHDSKYHGIGQRLPRTLIAHAILDIVQPLTCRAIHIHIPAQAGSIGIGAARIAVGVINGLIQYLPNFRTGYFEVGQRVGKRQW